MLAFWPSPGLLSVAASTPNVESWRQVGELALALVLSGVIGLEREYRQKSAGLRTHTLVGVGAALFVLVSKYGFSDVLEPGRVIVDPSRVAAQIVTGIGFLGAGLIFVHRGSVRGLTTAAGVWVTAAVGAAAGAGLPVLAVATVAGYVLVTTGSPLVVRLLPHGGTASSLIRVRYPDGRGLLRELLQRATAQGFEIGEVSTQAAGYGRSRVVGAAGPSAESSQPALVEVTLEIHGKGSVPELAAALSEIEGVEVVLADNADATSD